MNRSPSLSSPLTCRACPCLRWRSIAALLLTVVVATSCLGGAVGAVGGVDQARYAGCSDVEGQAAWQRAEEALQRQDDAAALPDLLLCAQRCPDFVRAQLAYQDAARRLGGAFEQAMVDFYAAAVERDSPVPAYLRARLAETAYAQSNALTTMLGRYPSFAWAHLSLARVLRGQGRLTEALPRYGAAIANDGSLHEARYERAQVLAELGRFEEAAGDYQQYLAVRSDDLDAARAYVTLLLYQLGRVDAALVVIRRLEAAGDRSIPLRMDRSAALWRSDQPRAAIEGYLDVLAEAPDTARAALNVGLLYYEVVPTDEAARLRYWPKARIAFRWFLDRTEPSDGHEQFERTWGVPYRLRRIGELLGPVEDDAPAPDSQLDALRWPEAGS